VSPGDRDRYQVQPHDSTLEQTADLQEKAAGDAAPKVDLPKPPSPPRKKMIEPELILVSSSSLPSKQLFRNSSVLLFIQPVVRDLSKVCKNFLALEEENRQLSAQLKDVRHENCSTHLISCSDDFASLIFNMTLFK
jgi:hypothetical protein